MGLFDGGGAFGLGDLVNAIKTISQVLNSILAQLKVTFPVITGTSSSATAGAATLPANPKGFINITLPNGTAAKVPYYDP